MFGLALNRAEPRTGREARPCNLQRAKSKEGHRDWKILKGYSHGQKLIQHPGEEPSVFEIKKSASKSTGKKKRKGKGKGHGKGRSNRDDDDDDDEPEAEDDKEDADEQENKKPRKLLAHSSRPRRANKGLIMRKDMTKREALEKAKETQRKMIRFEDDNDEGEDDEEQDEEEVDMEALMEEHREKGKQRRKRLGIMVHE